MLRKTKKIDDIPSTSNPQATDFTEATERLEPHDEAARAAAGAEEPEEYALHDGNADRATASRPPRPRNWPQASRRSVQLRGRFTRARWTR